MLQKKDIDAIYEGFIDQVIEKGFNYKTVKPLPSEWVENNLILPAGTSRIPGPYSYDNAPYMREIIDTMHPDNPAKQIAVMKGAQSGATTGFIVPIMMYIIVNHPDNILFTSKDETVATRTMRTKFDLFMQKSGFSDLIRSSLMSSNKRTGNTDQLKEYAGGQMAIQSTQNIQNFREFAAKYCLIDEFDTAITSDKKEGSLRATIEGRQTSYGALAKLAYISTPTIEQTSNIYQVYLEGDQRKWHWQCPSCQEWSPVEFQHKKEDKSYAGLVWELDENKELKPETVRYKFPCCGHEIEYKEKQPINRRGKYIPTAKPSEPYNRSYNINSLILGPGFISWEELVRSFLKACPPGRPVNVEKLKAFNFIHLGRPFREKGKAPKVMQIMENTRGYRPGIVPDNTCHEDGNGEIILISLAADLGGVMQEGINEDVRVDWAIVAHTSTGATYAIDHGSIGTFKRNRNKTKKELENDHLRERLTYMHNMKNSVWPKLKEIIGQDLVGESGEVFYIKLSLIDTGNFTKYAYDFIRKESSRDNIILGIKGQEETKYRKTGKDAAVVKKSTNVDRLYLLDTEQLKDKVADNMKLRLSDDGSQSPGFMNFPQPEAGKYTLRGYFRQFESEERREIKEGGVTVGFKWEKRNSMSVNHFWDVEIYNTAAPYIYIDLIKRSNPAKYKFLDWASLAELVSQQ